MGRTFLLLTIAATRLSIPLAAGTVSMQASSNLPFSPPGTSYCTQSGIGPVSCSINFNFSDPTGRNSVGGQSTATADFGSITGFLVGGGTNANLSAYYQSSFGDYVTVLGGSGVGTLITHYHLVSSDSEQGLPPSFAVPPLYRFLQGGDTVAHTPDLAHIPIDNPMASLTEDFDVTSPVIFGERIPLAAGTRTDFNFAADGNFGVVLVTTASAQFTGYTVLDSNGMILPGAVVQRSFSPAQPDPFAPEPGTLWMGIGGTLILLENKRRRRHSAKA
jgi:hypothetical protein